MDKPIIKWFAQPKDLPYGVSTPQAREEEIGEFLYFTTTDEQERWRKFVESKGGLEKFAKAYTISMTPVEH